MKETLGELQGKILQTIANEQSPIILQRVSDRLERKAPTVYESMKPLFESKLLWAEQAVSRGKRLIRLTDKGAAYAVAFQQVEYESLLKRHHYLKPPAVIYELQEVFSNSSVRQKFYSTILDFQIALDGFDKDGMSRLDDDVFLRYLLNMTVISEALRVVTMNPPKKKDFDADKFAELIRGRQKDVNSMIDQLLRSIIAKQTGEIVTKISVSYVSPKDQVLAHDVLDGFKRYYNEIRPKEHSETLCAILYYLQRFHGQSDATHTEIIECYNVTDTLAAVANDRTSIPEIIDMAESEGLVERGERKYSSKLTALGRRIVEALP